MQDVRLMNQGVKTIIYPVKDLAREKEMFGKFLGVEPYSDAPYYVGFKVGEQDIGLDPNGHKDGIIPYYHVNDIQKSLQWLTDSGAQALQETKNVGGGRLIASVRDADGNVIGLVQDA
jgi:predicted enzyme related to lactoylglutathione lyase